MLTNAIRSACVCLSSVILAGTAFAGASDIRQVAGYYSVAVGQSIVTALYDGRIDIDAKRLKGIDPAKVQGLLAKAFLTDETGVPTAVNAFLVRTTDHTILIDTGAAQCYGPKLGQVPANLAAAGILPASIDTVLITHLHGDHYCGLVTADGRAAYPKAVVYVAEAEAAYWLSDKTLSEAPADRKANYQRIRDGVALYQTDGRFRTFTPGSEIVPGVKALDTKGHTPGHTSYLVQSQGQSLLIWGDIVHNHAVQFSHPEVAIDFDTDTVQAVATRQALLAKVSVTGWVVAGAHLPFPGMGHVRKVGDGYAYVPLEYAPLP